MSKYHSKKTEICGITFDSKAEAERFMELDMLEKVGAIKDLALQVPFVVIQSADSGGKDGATGRSTGTRNTSRILSTPTRRPERRSSRT